MEAFNRVIVYTADVATLMGRSERFAREYLRKVRKYYKKRPYDMVTVPELCLYMNLDLEYVMLCLKAGTEVGGQKSEIRSRK